MNIKAFFERMISEEEGWPSTRRVLYIICLFFAFGVVLGALWAEKKLTVEMVDIVKTALYTTGGALAIGKFAEKSDAS